MTAVDVTTTTGFAMRLDGVEAGYGRTQVLRGVSLEVPRGKVVGLLGANGVGKTTLLRVAAGLHRPARGRVLLGDEDVTVYSADRRTRAGACLIPEGRGIFRSLTVRENLTLFALKGPDVPSIGIAIDAFPILGKRLGQRAGTLSGGEQQMLAVAKSYLCNPSLVMADELSLGLAPKVIDEIYASLQELNTRGIAMLVVEQYVHRILELADYVYVLSKGSVAWSGASSDLDEAALTESYLGGGS
jgi:branched-chain amino acid transport system ATP-binding protein